MYQKLNQNHALKAVLSGFAFLMLFGLFLSLPYSEIEAQNALGLPYGGKIIYFSPGYPWVLGVPPAATYGVCPPHMVFLSYGPIKGVLAVTVPPIQPKQWYNYYTPGNAVKGAYYPTPLVYPTPLSCPDAPVIFPHSLGGTSSVPSW
jgi:hypothetical protein